MLQHSLQVGRGLVEQCLRQMLPKAGLLREGLMNRPVVAQRPI
ncbi:hypothetical protein [Paenibacillus monticola]|nr:hypothetical protein [Paenibacillus monticola]